LNDRNNTKLGGGGSRNKTSPRFCLFQFRRFLCYACVGVVSSAMQTKRLSDTKEVCEEINGAPSFPPVCCFIGRASPHLLKRRWRRRLAFDCTLGCCLVFYDANGPKDKRKACRLPLKNGHDMSRWHRRQTGDLRPPSNRRRRGPLNCLSASRPLVAGPNQPEEGEFDWQNETEMNE
jgi:hypothetical protein